MKESQTLISSFQLQLKAVLHPQQLQILVFHRISDKFYKKKYNNSSIPYLVSTLFGNVQGLFKHLEEIVSQQSEISLSKNFKFVPPKLQMISYVCGGEKKVVIDFELQELNQAQNNIFLCNRLQILQSEERVLSRKWERLHQTTLSQQKSEQTLRQKLRQVSNSQLLNNQNRQIKLQRLLQIQKQIQHKKKELNNICQIYASYNLREQDSSSTQAEDSLQLVVLNQAYIQKAGKNIIKIVNNLTIGRQTFVSRNFITPMNKINLTFNIINLNFAFTFGISPTSKSQQIGFQNSNCITLCSQTQSINICGNRFYLKTQIQTKKTNTVSILLNRISNRFQVTNSDKIIVGMEIPAKMRQQPLYPFFVLSPGDQIQIVGYKRVLFNEK